MTSVKVKALSAGQMVANMLATGRLENNMEKEHT